MKFRYLLFLILLIPIQEIYAEIIAVSGIYRGKNLYVQNAFVEKESCVKGVFVNDQKIQFDMASNFFEINLSVFDLDAPVSIKIVYMSGCIPKILNSDVIKPGGGFSFINLKAEDNKMIWSTKKEKLGGRFIIEKMEGGKWKRLAELPGKSNAIINIYEVELTHHNGLNKYRIIYMPEEEGLAHSKLVEYVK